MASTADQTGPATDPAQTAIAPGIPETLGSVPQAQKDETHLSNLKLSLQLEGPVYLAIEA